MPDRCCIRKNAFGNWIVVSAKYRLMAWSGSSWVPVSPEGMAAGDFQVSNFTSKNGAEEYARSFGFVIAKED